MPASSNCRNPWRRETRRFVSCRRDQKPPRSRTAPSGSERSLACGLEWVRTCMAAPPIACSTLISWMLSSQAETILPAAHASAGTSAAPMAGTRERSAAYPGRPARAGTPNTAPPRSTRTALAQSAQTCSGSPLADGCAGREDTAPAHWRHRTLSTNRRAFSARFGPGRCRSPPISRMTSRP